MCKSVVSEPAPNHHVSDYQWRMAIGCCSVAAGQISREKNCTGQNADWKVLEALSSACVRGRWNVACEGRLEMAFPGHCTPVTQPQGLQQCVSLARAPPAFSLPSPTHMAPHPPSHRPVSLSRRPPSPCCLPESDESPNFLGDPMPDGLTCFLLPRFWRTAGSGGSITAPNEWTTD